MKKAFMLTSLVATVLIMLVTLGRFSAPGLTLAQDDSTPVPTLGIPIMGTLPPTPTPNASMIFQMLPVMGLLPGEVPQFSRVEATDYTLSLNETIAIWQRAHADNASLVQSLGALYRTSGVLGTHQRLMLAESCEGFTLFGFASWLRLLPGEASAVELFNNPLTTDLYAELLGWNPVAEHSLPGKLYSAPAPAELCSIPSTIYTLDYQYGPLIVALSIYAPNTTAPDMVLASFPPIIERVNERIAATLGLGAPAPAPDMGATPEPADAGGGDVGEADASGQAGVTAGTVDCANPYGVPMVGIPGGTFFMGLSDEQPGPSNERPGRAVTLSPFCIDTYEVTNARYVSCVNEGACTPPQRVESQLIPTYFNSPSYARFPVINVTWEQAETYCEYRGGRLPTEAEWEMVARLDPASGDVRTYPWGSQSPDATRANFGGAIGDVVEVGQHPDGASAFGVHDLSGNVAEWVWDWAGPYSRQDTENPTGMLDGTARVVRGGSWADGPDAIRGSYRGQQSPIVVSNAVGFRCVVPQPGQEE